MSEEKNEPVKKERFGGKGGAKGVSRNKGNKHAVKSGKYEHIHESTLTKTEREEWSKLNTDVLYQLEHEIKLITIRERRMLERIAKLEESAFMVVRTEDSSGRVGGKSTENTVVVSEASLMLIQQIEEALTRVQDKKARLIESKHKYESQQFNNDTVDLNSLVEAFGKGISGVWSDDGGTSNDGEKT